MFLPSQSIQIQVLFLSKLKKMSAFRFPVKIEALEKVKDHNDLRQRLIMQVLTSGLQFKNKSMKCINVINLDDRYVYARCLYRPKKCLWRMLYRKNKNSYNLSMQKSILYHNHLPFDDIIPPDESPSSHAVLWSSLHTYVSIPTMTVFRYSQDFKSHFKVPQSMSRRRNDDVDLYLEHLSFAKWVQNTKSAHDIDILYYPLDSQLPQIVMLTAHNSRQISEWHGQVVGIRKIDPKILQCSDNSLNSYKALIFYQLIPGWKRVAYMFAVYPEGSYTEPLDRPFHPVFNLSDPNYFQQSVPPETRRTKVNTNILKIVKTFLKVMCKKIRTLALQYDQQIIDTVQYLLSKPNDSKGLDKKINWIVDPTFYFADVCHTDDEYCFRIIHGLMKTCSKFEYQQQIKKYWLEVNDGQSTLRRILSHFHLHHNNLLPFARNQLIYTGGWFQNPNDGQKCLQLLIQRCRKKRTMVTVLDGLAKFMVEEIKNYDHRSEMILNTCYQMIHPYPYFKQARVNMAKEGFLILFNQTLQINQLNFLNPSQGQTSLEPDLPMNTKLPIPSYLKIQEKQQIYICKLVLHSKAWFLQYSKQNYICTKVDSSYYRARYECSCGFQQVKGIPCRHLLKICLRYDLAVYPYVESYWKFKESRTECQMLKYMMVGKPVPKVGRPKYSARRSRQRSTPSMALIEGYYREGERLAID